MSIFESLSGVFSCMLMICIGYYLTQRKWFDQPTAKLFSKMAMSLTIPLYMIVSMMKSYKKEDLMQLGVVVIVPFVTMLLTYVVGVVVSHVFRIPEHRYGTFRSMFFVANTAFIGFPVNVALFGEQALPYAVMYYLVQSLLFWTIGAYGMSLDGPKMVALGLSEDNTGSCTMPKICSKQTLKNILTPPLIGAVIAIMFILVGIKLPTFLKHTFQSIGGMTTPLAMLFIGISIYLVNVKSIRITYDVVILILARFLIAPAIIIVAVHFIEVPDLMRKVFIIEASMPVMTQCSIAARAYKADYGYVAVVTAITTMMSIVTIPTFFILIHFGIL